MNTGKRKAIALLVLTVLVFSLVRQSLPEAYDLVLSRIRRDTIYLCNSIGIRVTGTEKETEAGNWITEMLHDTGFVENETLFRVGFEGAAELNSENIIAVCNAGHRGPLFSVVAHYDSVSTSPGARDNAASVAVLLEMARYLGTENEAFPCEIRLVFLGSEENGYHGSKAYVDSLTKEEKARHAGAFNMDISAASDRDEAVLVCNTLGANIDGAYQEGNFIVPAEGVLTNAVRQAYRQLYGRELGGVFHFGESDHVSFHNAQLEAANVCWRRTEHSQPVLPVSYHQPTDTPEELNYETVRASGRCILGAIKTLCRE